MISPDYIFSILDKVADTSDHPKYQLAAALVLKNKIISFGFNRMKSHPFQKKYGSNIECIYLHAEIHAIKSALKNFSVDDLRKTSMFVLRKRDKKERALAKPCAGCTRAIAEFGIRSVTFTTTTGYDII